MASQIHIPVSVAIEAAEANGPPKFSSTAYTGGKLQVKGYSLPIVVDLAGLDYAKSIVANKDHDKTKVVGHVTDHINDGKTLTLNGIVSGTGEAANEVKANSANGFPWQMSIEALPSVEPTFIKAGQKVTVNGQTFEGPIFVATKSTLYGVAFLPRGADENTSVSIAAAAVEPLSEQAMKFNEWIEAMHLDAATLTDKQRGALENKFNAEIVAAASVGKVIEAAPAFDLNEIIAAHDAHKENLEIAFADYGDRISDKKKFNDIKAGAVTTSREIKSKALNEKWPAAKYEVAAIKAESDVKLKLIEAASPVGPAVHSSTRELSGEVIEAAFCIQRKMPNLDKSYSAQTLEVAHKNLRNVGLQQVMIMAAMSNGYVGRPGETIHNGNLREIMEYASPPRHIHAAPSTLSLSGILSNVANKDLLTGYMEEDQSWREIALIKSVKDFKQATSYRLLDNMAYEELAPGGKIKHGTVSSENYTRQAKTYAKMFSLTRNDIINDDLGAFDDIRTRLGGGAAMKFNDVFWAAFMGNLGTLFTSGRGNYITGATTNLGTDGVGLALALKAFRQLKTPAADGAKKVGGGSTVGGRPAILLVSPELEGTADKLFMGEKLNVGSGPGEDNIYRGKYRPVVSPWISDSAVTGYTATGWGLFRTPTMLAPMAVSFLNGVETPTIESAAADFDELGYSFRGYHDFGVDIAEYLAGVWSKGAA